MNHLANCRDLCESAPIQYLGASPATFNTGAARSFRFIATAAADFTITSVEFSSDGGATWQTCDIDWASLLPAEAARRLISFCMTAKAELTRVTFTGGGNAMVELYDLRTDNGDCTNDATSELSVECDDYV